MRCAALAILIATATPASAARCITNAAVDLMASEARTQGAEIRAIAEPIPIRTFATLTGYEGPVAEIVKLLFVLKPNETGLVYFQRSQATCEQFFGPAQTLRALYDQAKGVMV